MTNEVFEYLKRSSIEDINKNIQDGMDLMLRSRIVGDVRR